MNLTKEKLIEILEDFIETVESSTQSAEDNHREMYTNGDCDHLFGEDISAIVQRLELSDELNEALEESSLSKNTLVEKISKEGFYNLEYEELSSPFGYGGAKENEMECINVGGDIDVQIDRSDLSEECLSLAEQRELLPGLLDELKNKEFDKKEFVHAATYETFSSADSQMGMLYDLVFSKRDSITFNTNIEYDIVRVMIDHEDDLISYLQENPKEVTKNKVIEVSEEEYREMERYDMGFCLHCGEVNDGFHEPDARDYECDHCGERASYGASEALVMEAIIIEEDVA